jgi:hypothetical protein
MGGSQFTYHMLLYGHTHKSLGTAAVRDAAPSRRDEQLNEASEQCSPQDLCNTEENIAGLMLTVDSEAN